MRATQVEGEERRTFYATEEESTRSLPLWKERQRTTGVLSSPKLRRLTACVNTGVVLARAVSVTPPSIAIVALVLGGPECVRALC